MFKLICDYKLYHSTVINGEKMEIISNSDEILYDAGYSEKPLDFSGFVPIEIHLPFGKYMEQASNFKSINLSNKFL